MKWKIQYPTGAVQYCDPKSTQLVMSRCILKNNKKTAEKIMNGQHKTVCAWILCDTIQVKYSLFTDVYDNDVPLKYNPRVTPNWVFDGKLGEVNVDGSPFSEIISDGKKLFVTKM
jgi:hypothetical protein